MFFVGSLGDLLAMPGGSVRILTILSWYPRPRELDLVQKTFVLNQPLLVETALGLYAPIACGRTSKHA
jgi:hypothetical protein